MKVLGFCCSPRPKQTTYTAMSACLEAAGEAEGTETELIELAGKKVEPCLACPACREELTCRIDDDFTRELIDVIAAADVGGIIVGTPVYFGSMSAQCKALLDRCVMFRRNDWRLRDKVGGALAVGRVRNGGQELALEGIRAAMLCHDMICVGDGRPTGHFGAALVSGVEGGIEADQAGLETARNLGRRVAEVALRLGGQASSSAPRRGAGRRG